VVRSMYKYSGGLAMNVLQSGVAGLAAVLGFVGC
jgi:hypothetical protein